MDKIVDVVLNTLTVIASGCINLALICWFFACFVLASSRSTFATEDVVDLFYFFVIAISTLPLIKTLWDCMIDSFENRPDVVRTFRTLSIYWAFVGLGIAVLSGLHLWLLQSPLELMIVINTVAGGCISLLGLAMGGAMGRVTGGPFLH